MPRASGRAGLRVTARPPQCSSRLGHLQCRHEFGQHIDRVDDERCRGFALQLAEESACIVDFPGAGFRVGFDVQFHTTTAASGCGLVSRETCRCRHSRVVMLLIFRAVMSAAPPPNASTRGLEQSFDHSSVTCPSGVKRPKRCWMNAQAASMPPSLECSQTPRQFEGSLESVSNCQSSITSRRTACLLACLFEQLLDELRRLHFVEARDASAEELPGHFLDILLGETAQHPKIVVVSSLNVDHTLRVPHIPAPGETLTATAAFTCLGGKGANQALVLTASGSLNIGPPQVIPVKMQSTSAYQRWCSREDSNLHGLPHTVLSRARLPIPPHEHFFAGRKCCFSRRALQARLSKSRDFPTTRCASASARRGMASSP